MGSSCRGDELRYAVMENADPVHRGRIRDHLGQDQGPGENVEVYGFEDGEYVEVYGLGDGESVEVCVAGAESAPYGVEYGEYAEAYGFTSGPSPYSSNPGSL